MKIIARSLLLVLASLTLASCASPRGELIVRAQPEPILSPQFNNISHAGRFYFSGQPTPQGLAELADRGVGTVISIRTPQEHAERIDFDERGEVDRLGMRFVNLPMTMDAVTPELVDSLAQTLDSTDEPVLIHCGSSNRVGALWAAYLIDHHSFAVERAIEHGRSAGISRESVEQVVRDYAQNNPR